MSETGGLLFVLFMAENMYVVYEGWQKCWRIVFTRIVSFLETHLND